MIIHLQLCSIIHLHCELPSIYLVAENKTYLEKLGKKRILGEVRLEEKTAGKEECLKVGVGKKMDIKEKRGRFRKDLREKAQEEEMGK